MKMIAQYLEHALQFERMAAEAEQGPFKDSLLRQATAYRKLAAERAATLKIPNLAEPPKPVEGPGESARRTLPNCQ
jgi:hypothetical protein